MLNIEKYKDEIIKRLEADDIQDVLITVFYIYCQDDNKRVGDIEIESIKWLCEEYQEPKLDEVEKEYLRAIIRPFRKHVKYIAKRHLGKNYCNLVIKIEKRNDCLWHIQLPPFEENTMYKKMELGKVYTLEELGL